MIFNPLGILTLTTNVQTYPIINLLMEAGVMQALLITSLVYRCNRSWLP